MQEPFTQQDLYWPGVDAMPAFLLASRKLPPPILPGQPTHTKQHAAAVEAAVAAAAAALPGGALVERIRDRMQRCCEAALEQQWRVEGDMRTALQHVMGLGEGLKQGLLQSTAR
jgi:hypothetical protein